MLGLDEGAGGNVVRERALVMAKPTQPLGFLERSGQACKWGEPRLWISGQENTLCLIQRRSSGSLTSWNLPAKREGRVADPWGGREIVRAGER